MDQYPCHSEKVAGDHGHGDPGGVLPDSACEGNGTGMDAHNCATRSEYFVAELERCRHDFGFYGCDTLFERE